MRPIDKVSSLLSTAQSPGQVLSALSADPTLLVGLILILAVIILMIRILLWPAVNPFKFQDWFKSIREWFQDAWTWLTTPGWTTAKKGNYPYAKVIYPTYR
jgi:hypothetical protein